MSYYNVHKLLQIKGIDGCLALLETADYIYIDVFFSDYDIVPHCIVQ